MPLPLFEVDLAIESMRYSDFDANSAYGEIVDNSIQANAQNIKIQFDYDHSERKQIISKIAFGDDGHGMSKEIIYQCLQAGYSTRYNDRTGIGRFGVGSTLAAINQCKKIEIYSKEKASDWFYIYTDLDETKEIMEPVKKEPPTEYAKLISPEQGTLVIWSKYDRQDGKASGIIEEFKIWAGRTYRKFIWDGVVINIDGEDVYAIDPLYLTTEKTKFPDDPKSEEYNPIKISCDIPEEELVNSGQGRTSTITIRMSLLPEKFRQRVGDGNNQVAKLRHIDKNEGISIMRNGREVFYGHIPYFSPQFEVMDRWWGCEISFDAVLDKRFLVKNIKRGAVPDKELKKEIEKLIKPTRKNLVDIAKKYHATIKAQDAASSSKSSHKDAENIARKTPLPNNISFTIEEQYWDGEDFFRTSHLGSKSILFYNTGHIFNSELSDTMDKMEQSGYKQSDVESLKTMINLLTMSFAKAEISLHRDAEMNIEDFLDQLKREWGNSLASYTKTLKREESKS